MHVFIITSSADEIYDLVMARPVFLLVYYPRMSEHKYWRHYSDNLVNLAPCPNYAATCRTFAQTPQ